MGVISAAERVLGPLERVVVFRAANLGDMLCATPALRALRAGLPGARITLVTLPDARALAQRLDSVDEVLSFPGYPGLPGVSDLPGLPGFLAQLQIRRFDLAIQLHDGGAVTNPLVATFGARHMAGFRQEGHWSPAQDERWMLPWDRGGHEIERLLQLTDTLGIPRQGTHLDFPLRDEDHAALAALWPGAGFGMRPYVCVHPGARLASRCWPPERFAAVADALVASGFTVVLTGTALESPRVNAVVQHMRHKAINLAGLTNLWTLGALIERAHGVVCNDTSVSHMAVALGRPSVVISHGSQGEGARWQPLDRQRHQFLSQDDAPTWHDAGLLLQQPSEAGVRLATVLRCLDFEADKPWCATLGAVPAPRRVRVVPADLTRPRQLPVDRQRESALQG